MTKTTRKTLRTIAFSVGIALAAFPAFADDSPCARQAAAMRGPPSPIPYNPIALTLPEYLRLVPFRADYDLRADLKHFARFAGEMAQLELRSRESSAHLARLGVQIPSRGSWFGSPNWHGFQRKIEAAKTELSARKACNP